MVIALICNFIYSCLSVPLGKKTEHIAGAMPQENGAETEWRISYIK